MDTVEGEEGVVVVLPVLLPPAAAAAAVEEADTVPETTCSLHPPCRGVRATVVEFAAGTPTAYHVTVSKVRVRPVGGRVVRVAARAGDTVARREALGVKPEAQDRAAAAAAAAGVTVRAPTHPSAPATAVYREEAAVAAEEGYPGKYRV